MFWACRNVPLKASSSCLRPGPSRLLRHVEHASRRVGLKNHSSRSFYASPTLHASESEASHNRFTNPLDVYRSHIADQLAPLANVPSAEISNVLYSIQDDDIADLTVNINRFSTKSRTLTEDDAVAWCLDFPDSSLVEKPTTRNGFLNFRFKTDALAQSIIPRVLVEGYQYGRHHWLGLKDSNDLSSARKRVLIEFSSPNIAKPFHAGHLRSTIIGGFLANIYEALGWDVIRYNFLGDWGKQFGLLAVGFQRFGDKTELASNPIGHLYDVYVRVNRDAAIDEQIIQDLENQISDPSLDEITRQRKVSQLDGARSKSTDQEARNFFRSMEQGDTEALSMWRDFREHSIVEYRRTYARLNIHFDYYAGESFVQDAQIQTVVDKSLAKELCLGSEGAVVVDFNKAPAANKSEKKRNSLLGKAILQKGNKSSIYLSRDVAEAIQRESKHKFDKMLYVVASQQNLHMAQLLKLLGLLDRSGISDKSEHINFGMVLGMSTRRGTVKFLDDILEEAYHSMRLVMVKNEEKFKEIADPQKTADILGISAVMIQDMKSKRIKDYDFSIDRMTSLEGDTGPYLQYSHARLCSIARKTALSNTDLQTADLSLLKEHQASNIIKLLIHWPAVVLNAHSTHEPSHVVTYLFKLSHAVNASYRVLKVVGSEQELQKSRMALYESARQVLNNGMRLLGLTPLERV